MQRVCSSSSCGCTSWPHEHFSNSVTTGGDEISILEDGSTLVGNDGSVYKLMAEKLGGGSLIINLFLKVSDGVLNGSDCVRVATDVSFVGAMVSEVRVGLAVGGSPVSGHVGVSCLVASDNCIDVVQGVV